MRDTYEFTPTDMYYMDKDSNQFSSIGTDPIPWDNIFKDMPYRISRVRAIKYRIIKVKLGDKCKSS